MTRRATPLAAVALLALLAGPPARSATVGDPGQGPVTLGPGADAAVELGGLAWAGGDAWLVVSDDVSAGPRAFAATVAVDGSTGTVVGSPSAGAAIALAAGGDPEGIALDPGDATFVVADEVGPTVRRFDLSGATVASAALPPVFAAGLRSNLGLESVAVDRRGRVWTATEEALTADGPVSSFADGTIVRIQRLTPDLQPDGQWGYVTDPISGDVLGSDPGRDVERSGVVELAVLPDGTVLVLERMLGGAPPFGAPVLRSRLYELDLSSADDTTSIPSLSPGGFTPAAKLLRWEATFDALSEPLNFEGMGLGPRLDDGRRSLLLVSDDGGIGGPAQALYPLAVTLPPILADGFESGDLAAWSASAP